MSKRKLLLADDSVTIQKVVNLTFADEGIDVIAVGDGNSAMDKIREEQPDLILADVNMPGLNGYEICEKVRQADGKNRTPVILLVGSFEPFDEVEAKRVGADDYLTKPFQSINQLVNTVTVLLNSDSVDDGSHEESHEFASSATAGNDDSGGSTPSQASGFDESSIDDEMIQTDQVGAVPVPDLAKFETLDETYEIGEFQDTERVESPTWETEEDLREYSIVEPLHSMESDADMDGEPDQEVDHSVSDDTGSFEIVDNSQSYGGEQETSGSSEDSTSQVSDSFEVNENEATSEVLLDESNLLELPLSERGSSGEYEMLVETEDADLHEEYESSQAFEVSENPKVSEDYGVETSPSPVDVADAAQDTVEFSEPEFATFDHYTGELGSSDFDDSADSVESPVGADPLSTEVIDEITRRVEANLAEKTEAEETPTQPAFDPLSTEVLDQITFRVEGVIAEKAKLEADANPVLEVVDPRSPEIIDEITLRVQAKLAEKTELEDAPPEPAFDPFSTEVLDQIAFRVEGKIAEKAKSEAEANPVEEAVDPRSPEMINEISRLVVENLSDKAIKEIAWDIVPTQSERIIRQIAEEKMKE